MDFSFCCILRVVNTQFIILLRSNPAQISPSVNLFFRQNPLAKFNPGIVSLVRRKPVRGG
jgi:hypothetical protein